MCVCECNRVYVYVYVCAKAWRYSYSCTYSTATTGFMSALTWSALWTYISSTLGIDLPCIFLFHRLSVSRSLYLSILLCLFLIVSLSVVLSLSLSLSLSLISFSLSLSMLCLQLLDGDYIVHEHVDLICDHMTHSCVWHDSFATWWLFLYVTWLSERRLRLSRTYWLDLLQAPALHEVSYVLSFICV